MTDLSLSSSTLPVPHADSVVAPAHASTNGVDSKPLVNGFAAEEEEDYTIKCVCDYDDDDGNTVQCETCETWQHIECYYPGTSGPGEEETHNCVDCDDRPIDGKRATERQQLRRTKLDLGDRKVKKLPVPKAQRKKVKSEPTNGWHPEKNDAALSRNGASGSPREGQATKRPKVNHRSSSSTTHIVPLKLPSQSRRSTSASHTIQSPSKANNPFRVDGEPFSEDFMHLYDNDPGETAGISPPTLSMLQKLIEWSNDPDAVKRDANGKSHHEIFWRCEQSLESMNLPILQKQTKVDTSVEWHGAHPKWAYLTVDSETPKNAIVGELRGQIGHMNDYVQDERNRWDDIRHPLPFVFFHPNLPFYIDTRQEGSLCRYVRRSCKPNVHLKTILEGSDYRFCFVANRLLQPGELLTIPWTPDEHVRAITRRLDEQPKEKLQFDGPVEDEEYVRQFFAKVLAEFGGCACDDPGTCALNLWNRRKTQDSKLPNGKAKRGRKAGAKTGQGTGRNASSRSGSEALRYQDEDDQDDAQSTSASSRSKPQSRDMTPSNELDLLGPDVDDRTKRKIAALEKQEHDKNQPATKKKKRNSGGTSLSARDAPASASRASFPDSIAPLKNGSGSVSFPSTPIVNSKGRYVDAGTLRKGSNSPVTPIGGHPTSIKHGSNPHSPTVSSPLACSNYVDLSIQCDMDEDERLAYAKPSPQKRCYQSLGKRLLKRFHHERFSQVVPKIEPDQAHSPVQPSQVAQELTASPLGASPEQKDGDGDIAMGGDSSKSAQNLLSVGAEVETPRSPADAESAAAALKAVSPDIPIDPALTRQPVPPPSTFPTDDKKPANSYHSTNMHIPLPPKQAFAPPPRLSTSISSLNAGAPASAGGSIVTPTTQTPTAAPPLLTPGNSSLSASAVAPSPVKKKLSLGDYMSRRSSNIAKAESASVKDSTSSASPTAGPAQKDSLKASDGPTKPLDTLAEEAAEAKGGENGVADPSGNTAKDSSKEPKDPSDSSKDVAQNADKTAADKPAASNSDTMDVDAAKPASAPTDATATQVKEDTKMADAPT